MDNEVKEFLAALQKKLVSIDYIKTEDIPNIGLYYGSGHDLYWTSS